MKVKKATWMNHCIIISTCAQLVTNYCMLLAYSAFSKIWSRCLPFASTCWSWQKGSQSTFSSCGVCRNTASNSQESTRQSSSGSWVLLKALGMQLNSLPPCKLVHVYSQSWQRGILLIIIWIKYNYVIYHPVYTVIIYNFIIHSKYFPVSDWLKPHT